MRITICGHAGVLVDAGDERLLVDPVFADRFASGTFGFHPARSFDLAALPEPTAVLVTHAHLDHWHPATLARFAHLPLYLPPHEWLVDRCRAAGAQDVRVLTPWSAVPLAGATLLPTPSLAEIDEVGFAVVDADGSYWHMSDAVTVPDHGRQLRSEIGSVDLVATRYAPVNLLVGFQRGLGTSIDERDSLVDVLEAACEVEPVRLFPYFAGIRYADEHTWANAVAFPHTPAEVCRLLDQRLGRAGAATTVLPGDVLTVRHRHVDHATAVSQFVRTEGNPTPFEWDPIDHERLVGLPPSERGPLRAALEQWFGSVFGPWLTGMLAVDGSPFAHLASWGVVWQLTVHTGGEPLRYWADFRRDPPPLRAGSHPDANLHVHLGGAALARVLAGEAGAHLFYLSGQSRFLEKVLFVGDDGRIARPPVRGWDFWETLPEPLTMCLRKVGV